MGSKKRGIDIDSPFTLTSMQDALKYDVLRTYIYNQTQKYVIVFEPQTRNGQSYYLLTAYYLNKEFGERQLKKKMDNKLDEII